MRGKRATLVAVFLAVMAVVISVAQARTIFLVHYSGHTSQVYKGKPSPSISIDVDKTHHAVYYIGIAYRCPSAKTAWITRIHPSIKHGKIDSKGNFKYTSTTTGVHFSWITGHVTSGKITGKFAATHLGCNAKGSFTATRG